MVNAMELYGGTYLKVEIARAEKKLNKWLTISGAYTDDFEQRRTVDGKQETYIQTKVVLQFEEIPYELPLNVTNGRTMVTDFGSDTDEWIGARIKLRTQMYETGEGLVIKSKKELKDEGEEGEPSSSSDEREPNHEPKRKVKGEPVFEHPELNQESDEKLSLEERIINDIREELRKEGLKVTEKAVFERFHHSYKDTWLREMMEKHYGQFPEDIVARIERQLKGSLK